MKSRDQQIDELLAKQEIAELLTRYTRGCDRCDEDLLASVYHPDAIDDHGPFNGPAELFAKWATEGHLTNVCTSHYIANSLVEVNGETAVGETYCHVWMRSRRDDGKMEDAVFGGRYIDKFSRRNGVWKIAARSLLIDWHTLLEVRELEDSEFKASFVAGSRNRNDPSYALDKEWIFNNCKTA